MHTPVRRISLVYLVVCFTVAMLICMVAAVKISIDASEQAIRKAEQGQCEGIQADIDAYREEPPQTKAGKHQLQAKLNRLRVLHCPEGKTP